MALRQYHFRTDWRFEAPLERVWEAITDLSEYPRLWKDFRSVRLCSGDGRSIGSVFECETRGALPYTLRYRLEVLRAEPPRSIELASSGDLVGTGRWQLEEVTPGSTVATYFWDVALNRALLNLLAPLAKPLLARNHDQVMSRGYQALRGVIGGS